MRRRYATRGSFRSAWGARPGGFTLLEILIVAVILSIILAGVFDVLRLSTQGYARGDTEAALVQELEVTTGLLRADLRAAYVDAQASRSLTVSDGGTSLSFPRAMPGGAGTRPELALVRWSFEATAETSRLVRRVEPLPGGAATPAEERVVSTAVSAARFTVYSTRLEAPMLTYSTWAHQAYAPLLVRMELTAGTGTVRRELVTSVSLQPYSRRQLDPYWNPVVPP